MKWLRQFLLRQIRYGLGIGGFLAGGYIIQQYFHQYWAIGSVMLFIAVIIGFAWIMSFFNSETWTNNDGSSKHRESPFETQRREFEEDMNAYQREQEDKAS